MLVTMKEILDKASAGNYAVAAPNLWTELDARAVIDAAEELRAPLILDIAYPANPDLFLLCQIARYFAQHSAVPVLKQNHALLIAAEPENVDLALGLDLSTGYLETKDFNHAFRILETLALRIKRPEAIVVFD